MRWLPYPTTRDLSPAGVAAVAAIEQARLPAPFPGQLHQRENRDRPHASCDSIASRSRSQIALTQRWSSSMRPGMRIIVTEVSELATINVRSSMIDPRTCAAFRRVQVAHHDGHELEAVQRFLKERDLDLDGMLQVWSGVSLAGGSRDDWEPPSRGVARGQRGSRRNGGVCARARALRSIFELPRTRAKHVGVRARIARRTVPHSGPGP